MFIISLSFNLSSAKEVYYFARDHLISNRWPFSCTCTFRALPYYAPLFLCTKRLLGGSLHENTLMQSMSLSLPFFTNSCGALAFAFCHCTSFLTNVAFRVEVMFAVCNDFRLDFSMLFLTSILEMRCFQAKNRQFYKCPRCGKEYGDLDINILFDPFDRILK